MPIPCGFSRSTFKETICHLVTVKQLYRHIKIVALEKPR